jgi:hypothetical protein
VLRLALLAALLAGCNGPHLLGLHTTIPARAGNPPIPALDVSLDDPQGLVRAVSAPEPVYGSNPVDVVPGSNNAYRVTWLTNPCETHSNLSIGWLGVDLGITVRSDQGLFGGTGCSQVGIRRQVVIELNQFVPSTQFSLTQSP